jgi:hypothetical protein
MTSAAIAATGRKPRRCITQLAVIGSSSIVVASNPQSSVCR